MTKTTVVGLTGQGGTWYRTNYAIVGEWGTQKIDIRHSRSPGLSDFNAVYTVSIIAPDGDGGFTKIETTQVGDAVIELDFGDANMAGYIYVWIHLRKDKFKLIFSDSC